MSHIGITCPPSHSHLSNMLLLGRELCARGHRVTVFNIQERESSVVSEGLNFMPIGKTAFPLGRVAELESQASKMSGLAALNFTLKHIGTFADVVCTELPPLARDIGIDAFLIDQDEAAGGSVAQHLNAPFVTISNGLAFNAEPGVPPVYMPWSYHDAAWARLRNRFCFWTATQITRSIRNIINRHRLAWGLPASGGLNDSLSPYAQISQQPPAFDLPRRHLPSTFHYVGPLRGAAPSGVPFPWEKLDGRPMVYASLGTLLSSRLDLFRNIVEACRPSDCQLVISHVRCLSSEAAAELSEGALVVDYAPQYELLARASVCISHGGINTVLDSLSYGLPVLVMPVMNDAFGTAARIEWTGCGQALPSKNPKTSTLRTAIQQLLFEDSYCKAARRIRDSIQAAGGVHKALDIVEKVIETRRPVFRD